MYLGAQAQLSPSILNIAEQTYLAAPQNWSIDVTSRGVVVGNSDGMLTFDGEHWRIFPLPGNHRVRAVKAVGDRVYGGGYGEFGYWQPSSTGSYEFHSLSQDLSFPLVKNEEIWHIESWEDGVLFQSFSTIYLSQQDSISIFQSPFSSGIMFTYRCLDKFFLQVLSQGLAEFDPRMGFRILAGTEALAEATVVGIVEYSPNSLLIATDRNGLWMYSNGVLQPVFQEILPLLSRDQVNKMELVPEGICIGTISGGIYLIDKQGSVLEHIYRHTGLADNTVLSLSSDKRGGVWAGLDQGIAYLDFPSPVRKFEDQSGELGIVYCAIEDQGRLYIGTNHGLFSRSWPDGPESAAFEFVPGTQGQVWSLKNIAGQLLCGHNAGTFQVIGDRIRKISDITGGWSWIAGNHDETWIQGTYTGLVQFSVVDEQIRVSKISGINSPIRDLCKDRQGNIWGVHPYRGLMKASMAPDELTLLSLHSSEPDWGLQDLNRLVMVQADSNILVKSDSGWFQLNEDGDKFEKVDQWNGIPLTAKLRRIERFENEYVGIEHQSVDFFGQGMAHSFAVSDMPTDPGIYRFEDGNWLIGLSQGFLVLNANTSDSLSWNPMFFSGIEIIGKEDTRLAPLPFPGGEVRLVVDDQGLIISIASGFHPQDLHYRFRIPGIQSNWSDWSGEASIRLPIIPSGAYGIEIERKEDGTTLSLQVIKEEPWFAQDWAIFLFFVIGGSLLIVATRWYQSQLERRWRKKQIEQDRARHAREIEIKNLQLEQSIEEQNQELAGITMNLVRKNEILLELRQDLKSLQKSKEADHKQKLRQMLLQLNSQLSSEKDWEAFEYHFTRVHQSFFQRLKHDFPSLTSGDLRLAAYLRMNLSSKEIAPLLHISLRSVENKRYRLRLKLDLHAHEQLIDLLLKY